MIENVVFDIGEVLFRRHLEKTGEALVAMGYPVDVDRVTKLFWGGGWNQNGHMRCLEHFLSLGEGTEKEFFQIAQKELGFAVWDGHFWQAFVANWAPNVSILGLTQELSDLPNRPSLSVCSNITKPDWDHLARTPVLRKFFGHALSFRVGAMKPDHRMFRRVEDLLGTLSLSDRSKTLFIDDRKENTDAAEVFGWQTFLYTPGQDDALRAKLREGGLAI